jgi:hypothetical protein
MRFALPLLLVLVAYFGWYYMGGKEKLIAKALTRRHAFAVALILLTLSAALFAQSSTTFKLF